MLSRVLGTISKSTRTVRVARLSTSTSSYATPRTIDARAEELLSAPKSMIPNSFSRIVNSFKIRFVKDNIDPELKVLLDTASAQLYYNCANGFDYEELCENFGLKDYMSSWYKLTLLHSWMVLMRMHVSLDANAYLRLQRGLLSTMWLDIDKRLEIVGQELGQVMSSQSDMKHMHGLHLQTFLEYDEGFLSNDIVLAGAIWRCMYLERECDPIHVLRVVTYIRSSLAYLDTLDMKDILVDGIKDWKQLAPTKAVLCGT